MAAKRDGRRPKAKAKARPRAAPAKRLSKAERERAAQAAKKAREREKKRAARVEQLQAQERALQLKVRRAKRKLKQLQDAAEARKEENLRLRRNQRRRERRRMLREGKTPPPIRQRRGARRDPHPPAEGQDLIRAAMVRESMKEDLRHAATVAQASYRTHVYDETAEVEGAVWRDMTDGHVGSTLGALGDGFAPMERNLFYQEMFFQGILRFVVAKNAPHDTDSPENDSRKGPGGVTTRPYRTEWYKAGAQRAISYLETVAAQVAVRHPDFVLAKVRINVFWSPIERRPERGDE